MVLHWGNKQRQNDRRDTKAKHVAHSPAFSRDNSPFQWKINCSSPYTCNAVQQYWFFLVSLICSLLVFVNCKVIKCNSTIKDLPKQSVIKAGVLNDNAQFKLKVYRQNKIQIINTARKQQWMTKACL